VLGAQRSRIAPQQVLDDLLLAQRLIDIGPVGLLEVAYLQRQTGALAEQVQQLDVDLVDTLAQSGQPISGRTFV
jgi:hypothetical protein